MDSTQSSPTRFTKDHFIGLLLVYAAHVDLEYTDVERSFILTLIGEETLAEVEAYYRSKTDFVVLDYLITHRQDFLPNEEGKLKTLALLKQLFEADGDYSVLEVNSFEFLARMFSSHQ